MKRARLPILGSSAHFTDVIPLSEIDDEAASLTAFACSYSATAKLFRDDISGLEFGLFAVDWNFPQEKIQNEFRVWLERQLRKRAERTTPFSRRGKIKCDAPRSWLKALGAKRLSDIGMTFPQARDYTEKLARMPLYSAKEEWSKAKRFAVDKLRHLFPQSA